MATPKPGEIRCPTCHRSTPPAAYCTQCGSAIPSDARARPRGMDRDELQDRIRARRSGTDPWRRGAVAGDDPVYERYEPSPEDEAARRARRPGDRDDRRVDRFDDLPLPASAAAAAAAAASDEQAGRDATASSADAPPDLTRDPDDWTAPVRREAPPVTTGGSTAPPADPVWPVRDASDPGAVGARGSLASDDDVPYPADAYADAPYDETADPYGYEYDTWEEPERRSSGAGAFAILGFLALGVLALLGGAVLAGVFSDNGVATTSPTASAFPSVATTTSAAPSVGASAPASAGPAVTGTPVPSGEPVVFPDGFVAEAQPCLPGTVGLEGCGSNGAVNSGQVEIWVGFQDGSPEDVLGVALIGPEGNTVGEVSIDLVRVQCQRPCDGYTYFNFSNLASGSYRVEVSRNGEFASRTSFEVS